MPIQPRIGGAFRRREVPILIVAYWVDQTLGIFLFYVLEDGLLLPKLFEVGIESGLLEILQVSLEEMFNMREWRHLACSELVLRLSQRELLIDFVEVALAFS